MSLSLGKALAFFTTKPQVETMITEALATRGITIDAANYTALVTNYPPASYNGAFAWVEASQGTAWLPGTVGGTYYPLGLYHSNGTDWVFTPSPSQATQSEVDAGTNNDKFVTPQTLANDSKWATKQAAITATDSNTGTWYPTMVSGAGAIGSSVHINTTGFKVIGSSLTMTGDLQANLAVFTTKVITTDVEAGQTVSATTVETETLTSTNGGDGSTSAVTLAGNNDYGGVDYYGAITLNNTNSGATNNKKHIRLNNTGGLEVVNNAYSTTIMGLSDGGTLSVSSTVTAPNLTSTSVFSGFNGTFSNTLSASGSITGNHSTAFIAGSNAVSNVSLQVPNESAIRNIGNTNNQSLYFDINTGGSNNGQFKFRGTNSYTEYAVINSSGINALTSFKGKSSFNVALDTEVTVDNYKFRVSNQGGVFPQVESNTSGTVDSCWSFFASVTGNATIVSQNSGTLVANNAWTTLFSNHGLDSRGDTVIVHITDKNAGKIYRVTFLVTNNASNTTGYNILVERII